MKQVACPYCGRIVPVARVNGRKGYNYRIKLHRNCAGSNKILKTERLAKP
jgi:hypothetical protein